MSTSTMVILTLAGALITSSVETYAAAARIWPKSTIRLTVVHWMPTTGVYQKWDALSGDFLVSEHGVVNLPVVGPVDVGTRDEAALAQRIAEALKVKIGLVNAPEATVTIVKFPPIYVVGDVTAPGTYEFRTGLTVLQALAVSGGEYRSSLENAAPLNDTDLIEQLRGLDNAIIRSRIRIARIQAELSEDAEPQFDLPADLINDEARAIYQQEKAMLVARSNLLKRQAKSFAELRDLLQAEIETLEKKAVGADADVKSVAKELRNIKSMVDKGIALPAKQGDLERMLRSYSAARLDLSTDTMRARQGIAEASRNLEGLYDRQRTELTAELQAEQASLDQLVVKRDAAQRRALKLLPDPEAVSSASLTFEINRTVDGHMRSLTAREETELQPDDVLRVTRSFSKAHRDAPNLGAETKSVPENSQ